MPGQLKAGTGQLFKGASDAKAGVGVLAAGASKLSAGSSDLAAGTNDLAAGSADLANGAADLSDGLGLIVQGIDSLPKDIQSDPDFQALKGALSTMQTKIGGVNDVPNADPTKTTLLGGINGVRYGLRSPVGDGASCDQDSPDVQRRRMAAGSLPPARSSVKLAGVGQDGWRHRPAARAPATALYDYVASVTHRGCPVRRRLVSTPVDPWCSRLDRTGLGQPACLRVAAGGLRLRRRQAGTPTGSATADLKVQSQAAARQA